MPTSGARAPLDEEQAEIASADDAIFVEIRTTVAARSPVDEHQPQVAAADDIVAVEIGGAVCNFAIDALVLDAVATLVGVLAFYLVRGITADDGVGEYWATVGIAVHPAALGRSDIPLEYTLGDGYIFTCASDTSAVTKDATECRIIDE
jgi:hypothetical protein